MNFIFIIFVLGIAIGIYSCVSKKEIVEPEKIQIAVHTKPKPKRKRKSQPDPIFKEAKDMLVNMGYNVTESKDLLKGTTGNVQDRVQQAMRKVKI